jgi:hypothetical protein
MRATGPCGKAVTFRNELAPCRRWYRQCSSLYKCFFGILDKVLLRMRATGRVHTTHTHTHTHTHTNAHRQTDRQTDRQTHTHTHTQSLSPLEFVPCRRWGTVSALVYVNIPDKVLLSK